MYQIDDLNKYPYFEGLLKTTKIEYIIDQLTGLVCRKNILEFVRYLIDNKEHFSLAIMDLDNFKTVNDTYGHTIGDDLLEKLGSDLIKYVGNNGLVGRFGGDEFLIITFNKNDYDSIHSFYRGMYQSKDVLRKHFISGPIDVFITGTLGSASFPKDASNFDDLFLMADKTLYRGKMKGRNCFIIYVHEKHKDLQIQKMANDDEATIIFNINNIFSSNDSFYQKMIDVSEYLKTSLRLDKIYYIDKNNKLFDTLNMSILAEELKLKNVKFNNELYKTDYKYEVKELSFGEYIIKDEMTSLLATRIKAKNEVLGFVVFGLKRTAKIWANSEIAILLFLGKTISLELLTDEKE